MKWIVADTEDDSEEIFKKDKTAQVARNKKVTQIFARTSEGKTFYNKGDTAQFLKWLESEAPCICYFHNLQYDLGNTHRNDLDKIDWLLVGSRLIKSRWNKVEFRNSLNLFPMTVKKLGEGLGFEKLKMDIRSKAYVRRDVDIVFRALELMQEEMAEFDVALPSTLGGLCVRVWKAMGGDNWFDNSEMSKAALYGGRVEIFAEGGKGNYDYVDINSLYPWAMTQKFPDAADAFDDIPNFGVAEITIKIPRCDVAPLPARRDDGSVYFPTGTIRGIWTVPEIRAAEKYGAKIMKFHAGQGSDSGSFYYDQFVREFYHRRLKTDNDGKKLIYKLLMNNLYGQLAMGGEMTRSVFITDDDFQRGYCFGIPFGKKQLLNCSIPHPSHVNFMHAAYVTGMGRVRLLEHLHLIPPDRLVYCDTDSIIYENSSGESLFPVGRELGEMKLEKSGSEVRTILPKCYFFDGEAKAKGVRKNLASEYIQKGEVTFEQPYKLREAVLFYDRENKKPLSVWHKITKRLNAKYNKKTFDAGRWFPLQVSTRTQKSAGLE